MGGRYALEDLELQVLVSQQATWQVGHGAN